MENKKLFFTLVKWSSIAKRHLKNAKRMSAPAKKKKVVLKCSRCNGHPVVYLYPVALCKPCCGEQTTPQILEILDPAFHHDVGFTLTQAWGDCQRGELSLPPRLVAAHRNGIFLWIANDVHDRPTRLSTATMDDFRNGVQPKDLEKTITLLFPATAGDETWARSFKQNFKRVLCGEPYRL